MRYPFFLFAAAVCFLAALALSLGASLFDSTWQEWVAGGLLAWVLATLTPGL